MEKEFGTHGVKINAEYLSAAYPWIGEKYGYDQELDIEIKVIKPRIGFGPDSGNNVYAKADIKLGVKLQGEMNFIMFDHFFFETEFDFDLQDEIAYAEFFYMTLAKGGDPRERDTPIYNPEGSSPEDYAEFWSYATLRMEQWLYYFNTEVFGYGVPLPYWNLQFLTKLEFRPRAVIAMVELYYNM